MHYSILVLSPPHRGAGAHSALHFARALLNAGHTLHRVFFYDDGVLNGNAAAVALQAEADLVTDWTELGVASGAELILCVGSAVRRGVLDEAEAKRHGVAAATAHPGFVISGLGQLIDAQLNSDRLVTFGG